MNKPSQRAFAAIAGTALQWYDFSLFGYIAPLVATLYFPHESKTAALLYTFGAFAMSFLLAPIGALLFGYIGDNYGRKKALTLSIVAMAIPTACISILPTYEQVGILAPILLTAFRLIQGLVSSAEYAGSAIFLIEHAKVGKKFFYGSLTSSAYSLGATSAALIMTVTTLHFFPSWAWRIPFAFALVASGLLLYMRQNIDETPEFAYANQKTSKVSFITALLQYPRAVLCTILTGLFVGVITFGTYVYATTYMTLYSKISLSTAIAITTLALMVDACLEPFIAILADKWGGKRISVFGIVGIILFALPLFQLLSSGSLVQTAIGMIALSCLIAIACAPLNAFLVTLFPPACRFSGFAVSFNLSMAVGGSIPLLMTSLIYYSQNILAPAIFYILGGLVALLAMQLAKSHTPVEQAQVACVRAQS